MYLLTYYLHNRNGQFWPYLHNYAWLHPSYFCYFSNFQTHVCKNEVNVAISENSLHVPYIKEQVKLAGRKSWIPGPVMPEGEKYWGGPVVIGGDNLPSPGLNRVNWPAKYWGGQWPPWFRYHCIRIHSAINRRFWFGIWFCHLINGNSLILLNS